MSARNTALAIAFAALAIPLGHAAGESDAKPAEPAAAAPMPMPMDCAKMARHDHSAERGTPMSMSAGCRMAPAPTADKAVPKAKARKLGHDHARVHKLM